MSPFGFVPSFICMHAHARQWCLVTLLLSTATACEQNTHTLFIQADAAFYQHRYAESERWYRQWLMHQSVENSRDTESKTAERVQVLLRLARLNHLILRNFRQSIADFTSVLQMSSLEDAKTEAHVGIAEIYRFQLLDLHQSILQLKHLVRDFPQRPESIWAQLQVAMMYFELKRYTEARLAVAELKRRWPDSPESFKAQLLMAKTQIAENKYKHALQILNIALKQVVAKKLRGEILLEIGRCHQALGQDQLALSFYYRALKDHDFPLLVQRKIERTETRLLLRRSAPGIQKTFTSNLLHKFNDLNQFFETTRRRSLRRQQANSLTLKELQVEAQPVFATIDLIPSNNFNRLFQRN